MMLQESFWFQEKILQRLSVDDCILNIGSSTQHFREVVQPHIHDNLFMPLRKLGAKVVHIDLKPDIGVDLVGDVTDPQFVADLKRLGPTAAICSNLLEHLLDRRAFCTAIVEVLQPGGLIFVSCPYAYPYHADPIDTMFRPDAAQLAAEFPDTCLVEGSIVDCGAWRDKDEADRRRNPHQWRRQQRNRSIKLFLPFYRPKDWWRGVTRQDRFHLDQHISATCVVLRKNGVS